MSITIEAINGISAQILWTCPRCGQKETAHVNMGIAHAITCRKCGFEDTVTLDETVDGEVG